MWRGVAELSPSPWYKNGTRLAIAVFLLNFLVFVANLYLSNGYVAKATYDADLKDAMNRREKQTEVFTSIAVELRGIKDHMEVDATQNAHISALENDVRTLERGERGKR